MYRLVTFDGLTLPKAAAEVEIGTVSSRPALLAYRGGVIDADGTQRAKAELPYQLPMRCEVTGADLGTLRTELDALRAKRGVSGQLVREGINAIGTYQWATARLLQAPELRNTRNVYYHPLTLMFLVLTHWHGITIYTQNEGSFGAATSAVTLANAGQLPVTQVAITINAITNPITGVTLAAADGSSAITYTGTITAGTALTINAATWAVQNAGVDDSDHLTLDGGHRIPELLEIAAGGTAYNLTLLGGWATATAQFQYYELYE